VPREIAVVVPVVAIMLFLGVYPNVALDRINPSSESVVAWVRSVDVEQSGLPGGLRAATRPVATASSTPEVGALAMSREVP
jgi:hypothetical protein